MASITQQSNGRRSVQLVLPDRRVTFRLGKVSKQQADEFKQHVQQLADANRTGTQPRPATIEWLKSVDDRHHDQLVKLGLCESRQLREGWAISAAAYVEDYISGRAGDVKPGRITTMRQAAKSLAAHLGNRSMKDVTAADAGDFKRAMQREGLSAATIAKRVKDVRMFFKDAVDRGLLKRNPFAQVKAGAMTNRARQHFVSRAETRSLLDAAPDLEWRLIIALARFAGLRCPCELRPLTWADIDVHGGTMLVHSSKTAHQGKASRRVPIDAELMPLLLEAHQMAEPGVERVITRPLTAATNLRTQFERIIKLAKLTPWPKLFNNLRSSRQTELRRCLPQHIVCDVMGNSRQVASDHYEQTLASDLAAIAAMKFEPETGGAESGARSGAKGGAAADGTTMQLAAKAAVSRPETNEKGPPPFPAAGLLMTPTGIEPVSRP
jgi:integrase